MKYALLIAWREYAESAKAKGFWISIFVMPIVIFCSIQAPILLEKKATPVRHFVIVDQSGLLAPAIRSRLETATRFRGSLSAGVTNNPLLKSAASTSEPASRAFEELRLPEGIDPQGRLGDIAEALKPYLRGAKKLNFQGEEVTLSAAVLVPSGIESQIIRPPANGQKIQKHPAQSQQIQFWSVNNSDNRLHDEIERAIKTEVQRREYLARGMDAAAIREVEQTYAPFVSLNPKKQKGKEAVSTADTLRQWAPSGFVYLLWLSIFVVIQMLLNNTIEEKSNRIIEVLLSSVTPGELMMGKLIGIAGTGLTMVAAWMIALFGILTWKTGAASDISGQLLTLLKGSNLVPLFCLYFLLGYLLYAGLILSIGSVCNTIKEAQSYMGLLTMVMMVPLLTMTFIPKDPNGTLARVLSWIPIYTPFTMMNRAAAEPPLFDLIGTLVLLITCTLLALWMSGKIFRIGILRTGQPPKIFEMVRWLHRSPH
jgi:ABC-2 type transport system permease protein